MGHCVTEGGLTRTFPDLLSAGSLPDNYNNNALRIIVITSRVLVFQELEDGCVTFMFIQYILNNKCLLYTNICTNK
jgi:hypothetical protein